MNNTYDMKDSVQGKSLNKEDLSDLISSIGPTDSPLYSMLKTSKASNTYHEWLEDELEDDAPDNYQDRKVEGFTYSVQDGDSPMRFGNYTQILSRGFSLTDTQSVIPTHMKKNEMARQMKKKMLLIAQDCEKSLLNNDAMSAGTKTTAREMAGLPYFLGVDAGTPKHPGFDASCYIDNGGTARDISEEILNDALQATFALGGKPSIVMLSPSNKRKVSAWTNSSTKYMEEGNTKLQTMISVYESDFGIVKFMMNRFMDNTKAYVLDPSMWKIAYLRRFKQLPLPKTGDSESRVIVGELTLESRASRGNAVIADLQ